MNSRSNNVALICIAFASLVILLAGTAYNRNALWKDNATLWGDVISRAPERWRPYYALGSHYLRTGNYDKAVACLQEVVRREPYYLSAYWDLATAFQRSGNRNMEILVYREALSVAQELAAADPKTYSSFTASLHKQLGMALAAKGDREGSKKEFQAAQYQGP